jgi:hypothetical protein
MGVGVMPFYLAERIGFKMGNKTGEIGLLLVE